MQHHAHHHRHISSLMSHHWVHNKCNRVKRWHWRWLIYSPRNMLHVFRSNHHCFWKFHKFHLKTPELESLFLIKMMELYKEICSAWISLFLHKFFLVDWCPTWYIAILSRTILWIFRIYDICIVIYENAKKKHSFHNKHIDIGHWHFEVLWSFILYIF